MIQTDIAIIGGGPAGLFTIFQAGMLGLKCTLIETLDNVGGQCAALYPQKPIYDIPAYPEISAGDLVKKLMEQAKPFNPTILTHNTAVEISRQDEKWLIKTNTQQVISCKAIIIAAGSGAFGPNKPPLDNLAEFEGRSVFYSVVHPENFEDKVVAIAGGGDSAVDWAIILSKIAKKVYVIHRRDKFRAHSQSIEQMLEIAATDERLEIITPYQLHAIHGQNGNLSSIDIIDLDQNIKTLQADILLSFFGLAMELGPILDWGLEIEKRHVKVSSATMATNLPGVYAVGDIAAYAGKLKLILCGFAEVAMACHTANQYINPDKAIHFEYSTTRGVVPLPKM